MKKQKILLMIWILAISFAFSACQKNVAENNQAMPRTLATFSPTVSLSPTPTPDSPIRKIDFKNFTYPDTDGYEKFELKNGGKTFIFGKEDGIELYKINYFDLTNDGKEEAILFMSIQTGGSATPNLIYVYALENEKPKLLWSFMTGDRASGGLKKIYTENDSLIVETFGDNKFVNNKWKFDYPKGEFKGDCCPTAYTKISFKWTGKKFVVQGKPELLRLETQNEEI